MFAHISGPYDCYPAEGHKENEIDNINHERIAIEIRFYFLLIDSQMNLEKSNIKRSFNAIKAI